MSAPRCRVGQGFDVHPFSDDPTRPLVLGGVRFDDGPGLAGHSDADAIAHAVTDAVLGAAGLGDIGQHFPDTDPVWAGADSIDLLRRAMADVRAAGWRAENVDCTVVLEAPRLAPHRPAIESRLSDVVGAPVTVKGKRAEGLGALGRREAIACLAVALLTDTPPASDSAATAAATDAGTTATGITGTGATGAAAPDTAGIGPATAFDLTDAGDGTDVKGAP